MVPVGRVPEAQGMERLASPDELEVLRAEKTLMRAPPGRKMKHTTLHTGRSSTAGIVRERRNRPISARESQRAPAHHAVGVR